MNKKTKFRLVADSEDQFETADDLARKQFPDMHLSLDIRNCLRAMIKATDFFDEHEGSGCGPVSADFRFYTKNGKHVAVAITEIINMRDGEK